MTVIYQILETVLPFSWLDYNFMKNAFVAILLITPLLGVLGTMGDTGRRIAVLGSMLELGDYTEEGHRRAGRAAAEHADVLYAYGPSADAIARGAEEKGMAAVHAFTDQNELVEKLRADAKPGDALLFKGSRGMRMERALALFLGEEVE